MIKDYLILALIFCSLICGCSSPRVKLSPLELQAMQQREFSTDSRTAFSAVVTVLQDLGYTIENSDSKAGLISTKSATESMSMAFYPLQQLIPPLILCLH